MTPRDLAFPLAQTSTDVRTALWIFAGFLVAAAVSAFLQRPRD
jgi:hypothetical protein